MKRYRNTALNTDSNFKDPEKLILKKKRRDFDDEFADEQDVIEVTEDESESEDQD